jgi:hypothetical protein
LAVFGPLFTPRAAFPERVILSFRESKVKTLPATPTVVMPGLDPGIHVQRKIDPRVKPVDDGRRREAAT